MMATMMRVAALSLLAGPVAAQPGAARDCRPVEAPPGVRLPERAGCKPPDKPGDTPPAVARGTKPAAARAGRAPGFIDLGNGTQVRIGGEVDVEVRGGR